jgi:hypothetical protein
MGGEVGTIQSFFSTLVQPLSHFKHFLIFTSALCAGKDNSLSFIVFLLPALLCNHTILSAGRRKKHQSIGRLPSRREREKSVSPKEQKNQRNGKPVKYINLRSKFTKKYFLPSSPMPQHISASCAAVSA